MYRLFNFLILLAIAAAAGGAGTLYAVYSMRMIALPSFVEKPEPKVDIRSSVVEAMRGADELTTAIAQVSVVMTAKQEWQIAGWTFDSARVLYIARGEVRAGTKLSDISISDMQVDDPNYAIAICMPYPTVLVKTVDVEQSDVYDWNNGTFFNAPPGLVQKAQVDALQRIEEDAKAQGLLDTARKQSETVVRNFVAMFANGRTATFRYPGEEGCPGLIRQN